MRSVLMVCHGNICRSPMAATLMRVMAEAAGWDDALWVDSCGVSDEEEGNPMDRRAVAMLLSHGIRPAPHEARRFSRGDYAMYDDILCMEERNRRGLLRLLGGDPEGKDFRVVIKTETAEVAALTERYAEYDSMVAVEENTEPVVPDAPVEPEKQGLSDWGIIGIAAIVAVMLIIVITVAGNKKRARKNGEHGNIQL